VRIRRAEPNDVTSIHDLIHQLAVFERSGEMVEATSAQLLEGFFGEDPKVFCELAVTDEGEVAGFAVWFLNYSTWTGTHGLYLEDLFVRPEFRGHGYGRAPLAHLARECVLKGYSRLQWWVLDWNQAAVDFYESLGAEAMNDWTVFRISGDSLDALANL